MVEVAKDNHFKKKLKKDEYVGTLNYYCELLGDVCSRPTKYEFLNYLVSMRVLLPVERVEWGKREFIKYKIDYHNLYKIYRKIPVFRKAEEIRSDFAVVFDFFHD